MSRITLAPNASGTGTLTVAAPNTNTDRTLTLPDVTTTLVGTDASQTLTNKSIASSQLTGALPAIDGSALTGIVTGGMTLLGTLATTSGTSVTLSGLTLTSYKQLIAIFKNVSAGATTRISVSSLNITDAVTGATAIFGIFTLDLATGVMVTTSYGFAVGETNSVSVTSPYAGVQSTITTSSTSVTFSAPTTFDAGTITIYGVK